MSKPASRVIGIIRITEQTEFGVDLSLAIDDSTFGSLLAGLVGKPGERRQPRSDRWQAAAPRTPRASLRADLSRLREDLLAQYGELAVR